MIGLNKIGLNQVQLNRLRLNAPFPAYGKMAGGGGSGDGFPQLPGDVTRWHFGGLTNEMMAAMDDPRIEDADHKGRFLSFKNFAWKGMSGVGGYVTNKDIYEYDLDRYSYTFIENSTKVHDFYIVFELIGYDENFKDGFNLDVRSISQGLKYRKTYTKNGIYIFQYKDEEGLDDLFAIGYNGNGGARSNFTVKVLPLYPGALVFDGVDDYGVCDNFPILTKEKGYTVVALRQWTTPETKTNNEVLVGNLRNEPKWTGINLGAFQFEVKYNTAKVVQTDSFGKGNNVIVGSIPLSYQTSNSYNGSSIVSGGINSGGNFLTVGCGGDQFHSNVAIWELVILDHDATEEELAKIQDYYKQEYPWLFPYQAWTVTGKTNEDEDRATIANITGNGNDLILSNFGFAEGSGYNEEGEYAGYLVTDGVDDKIVSSTFKLGKDFTVVGEWEFLQDINNNSGLRKTSSFIIRNNASGLSLFINRTSQATTVFNVKSLKAFCSNGLLVKNDWTEQIDTVSQIVTSSNSKLSIACRDDGVTEYDKFAFKNLAIYPMVLSKDDCIKAYNYLQTLKAK